MKKTLLKTTVLLLIMLSTGLYANSQTSSFKGRKKGEAYVVWGWNLDAFTKSNISFKGADYDFKLYKVKAHHTPSPVSFKNYVRLDHITYPQTNLRIGYFIKDNFSISIGDDHMKYVMDQNQTVRMKGTISREGAHKGTYDGNKVMTTDFLTFEHTDGLNYINVEAEQYFNWYQSENGKLKVNGLLGAGVGMLLPKTNAKLLDYERNDRFHVSGFGLAAKAGAEVILLKHIMIRFENKYGYINMPDIILHQKGIEGRAKQAFFFTQFNGMVGANFMIGGGKKSK